MAMRGSTSELPVDQFPKGGEQLPGDMFLSYRH